VIFDSPSIVWHAGYRKLEGHAENAGINGDNDGIVTVDSTRLAAARDFLRVNEQHFFLLRSTNVQKYALEFLKRGYFVSEEKRQPIKP